METHISESPSIQNLDEGQIKDIDIETAFYRKKSNTVEI